eukprot:Gb_21534 [translate_table: standard]
MVDMVWHPASYTFICASSSRFSSLAISSVISNISPLSKLSGITISSPMRGTSRPTEVNSSSRIEIGESASPPFMGPTVLSINMGAIETKDVATHYCMEKTSLLDVERCNTYGDRMDRVAQRRNGGMAMTSFH